MNETIKKFLANNKIDYHSTIYELDGFEVKNESMVNNIIAENKHYKVNEIKKVVSIEDILGYNDAEYYDLIENMDNFFNENGTDYQKRSLSLLDIPEDRIMKELEESFKRDPIKIYEVDKGKYIIGDNGKHRFQVIKMHYLNELSKLDRNDIEAKKQLREKYSLNAKITQLDFIKTYSTFLNSLMNSNVRIDDEYRDYIKTDNVNIYDISNPDRKLSLNNYELIFFTLKHFDSFSKNANRDKLEKFNSEIKNALKKDSFKNFIGEINEFKSQNDKNLNGLVDVFKNYIDANISNEINKQEDEFEI